MDLNQWVPIWMLVPQLDELSRLSARCLKSWHSPTHCHYTHLHTVKVYAFFPRNWCMALWGGIAQTVRPPWNVFGRTQHAEVQRCDVCISFPPRCAGASRTCTGMHVGKFQPQPQPPFCGATFWQECHYSCNNVRVDRNERILTPEPFRILHCLVISQAWILCQSLGMIMRLSHMNDRFSLGCFFCHVGLNLFSMFFWPMLRNLANLQKSETELVISIETFIKT